MHSPRLCRPSSADSREAATCGVRLLSARHSAPPEGGGAVDLSLISDLGEVDLSPISGWSQVGLRLVSGWSQVGLRLVSGWSWSDLRFISGLSQVGLSPILGLPEVDLNAQDTKRPRCHYSSRTEQLFFVFFSRLLYVTKKFDVVCIFSSRSVFFVFYAMARSGLRHKNELFASLRETTGACSCVPCRGHDRARALSLAQLKLTRSGVEREVGRPTRTPSRRRRSSRRRRYILRRGGGGRQDDAGCSCTSISRRAL